jgi:hypothetical protein
MLVDALPVNEVWEGKTVGRIGRDRGVAQPVGKRVDVDCGRDAELLDRRRRSSPYVAAGLGAVAFTL